MALALRAALFLLLWLVLAGPAWSDLLVGAGAALLAAWTSVRLWPGSAQRPDPLALTGFVLRLIALAVLSGIDVARRAFGLGLQLRPGLVPVPVGLPDGGARDVFLTLMATVPGTIPSGESEAGVVLVHCLDTAEPVAADFAQEEARFRRAIGKGKGDG